MVAKILLTNLEIILSPAIKFAMEIWWRLLILTVD